MAVVGGQEYQFYRKYLFQIMQLYRNRADVRAFLEILLSLFTIAIFGLFAIKPTVVTIGGLITEIGSKVETSGRLDQKIQALSAAQQLYEQQRSNIQILENAIPDEPLLEDYVKQAEILALEHQVAMEIVSVKNVVIVGDVISEEVPAETATDEEQTREVLPANAQEIELTFGVSGPYQNLMAYMKDIEALRRPLLSDSIAFDSFASTVDEKIILTIKGRLGYLPKNKAATQ